MGLRDVRVAQHEPELPHAGEGEAVPPGASPGREEARPAGARAVLVGRPQAWSLSAAGQQGVSQMLGFFREELENAMISCGCRNVGDISSNLLLNTPPMD